MTDADVDALLDRARVHGMGLLDTAEAYGTALDRLGARDLSGFDIVSKIASLPQECSDMAGLVRQRVEAMLEKLGVASLYGLLMHDPADLARFGQVLSDALVSLKEENLVRRIGVSTYHPQQTDKIYGLFPFDLVQIPLSPLDRRWSDQGVLERLAGSGVEIHARSLFLQGLLLMQPVKVPPGLSRYLPLLHRWHDWCCGQGMSALEGAVSLALKTPADHLVIGVQSAEELDEIMLAAEGPALSLPRELTTTDTSLLDPSTWRLS